MDKEILLNNRPEGGERSLLVHVYFPAGQVSEDPDEFEELARSAGAEIDDIITSTRRAPAPKYFIGSGKALEIQQKVRAHDIQLVIFDHVLTPAQERNLERLIQCRVLDRTGLILDIFAQRARSFEGKLQVELAQLKHLASRLVRGWTHLERQRGGIGLRGPGETQLETDRRLIRNRIKFISKRLEKLRTQREQSRRARQKAIIPTVALVGYTNAGKSTLFNHLSGAAVYVADQLFATLDPTLRRIKLKEFGPVILADTVGFIKHLPHDLVEAFHATLEEVSKADLLLHVIDVQDAQKNEHLAAVNQVLESIHAEHVPRLLILNKIDLGNVYGDKLLPKIERNEFDVIDKIWLSAKKHQGMDLLLNAIAARLSLDIIEKEVLVLPSQGKLRALLYERQAVLSEEIDEKGQFYMLIRLPRFEMEKLFR